MKGEQTKHRDESNEMRVGQYGRRDGSTVHPQVHVEHGDQAAWVDEGLADFILTLWRAGYRTGNSCQAFGPADGLAVVGFVNVADAHRFADAIGSLAVRMPDGSLVTEITEADEADATQGDWLPIRAFVAFSPSRIAEAARRVRAAASTTRKEGKV